LEKGLKLRRALGRKELIGKPRIKLSLTNNPIIRVFGEEGPPQP